MKLIPISGKGCENLYRHPKTNIIYFKIYREGKGQIERSTFTTGLSEARRIADDYRLEFLGVTKVNRGRKLCEELFPEWIKRKSVSTRPSTISSIELSWSHLRPYIGGMLPDEITAEWWESVYVPEKRVALGKDRKFFNDRKWLSMFLISLKKDGVIHKAETLIEVDSASKVGKVYSDEEIQSLLSKAGPALQLQILMAVTMGMRIGEIMGMTVDRIDSEARTMHLSSEQTKTKNPRTFGISEPVWKRLWPHIHNVLRGSPLFPSPEDPLKPQSRQGNRTAWTTCKANAKVTGRFHDLRHTFLTKAFKSATNPALICHYAGLSLEEAERTYLHFTVDDTRGVAELVRF